MTITVKDMKCGFCGVKGHTQKTCEKKKEAQIVEENQRKKELRKKSKKYSFGSNKANNALLNLLTNEGKDALTNGRMLYSTHFVNPVKPETAVCESMIEPFIEGTKNDEYVLEYSREPTFTTLLGKKKHLDYLITITEKSGTKSLKWLVEAEAPNRSHKGIEQVEDFIEEVPNISEYGFIVTDGFHYHFTDNTNQVLEWEHLTINETGKVRGRIFGLSLKDRIKQTVAKVVVLSLIGSVLFYGLVM